MSIRVFGHYCPTDGIQLFTVEAAAMAAGVVAALRLATGHPSWLLLAAVLLVLQLALYVADLHDIRTAARDRQGGRMLKALGAATLVLGLTGAVWPGRLALGPALPAVAFAALPALCARWCYLEWVRQPRKVILLGEGSRAAAVRRAIEKHGEDGVVVVAQRAARESPQGEEGFWELSRRLGADLVIVALEDRRGLPAASLLAARLRGVGVLEASQFIEQLERRIPLDLARPGDLAFAEGPLRTRGGQIVKRAFDLIAASCLLLCAAPVMLLAALAVRLGSRGPIFYRQERLGRDGKGYTLVKFRTMRLDAEAATGPVWAQERDPRVTWVGAFLRRSRLDELPQLFNVLGGTMSLVGPRPERAFFSSQLREHIPLFDLRLAAKPGVTGWAQLRYPYGASIEDARAKLELNLYYLKNWSPFLDLVVAFHTAKHVLLGRGSR